MSVRTAAGYGIRFLAGWLLVGLFGMHGLSAPMAGASSDMTTSSVSTHYRNFDTPIAAAIVGCHTDHAGCVAILRISGPTGAAPLVAVGPPSVVMTPVGGLSTVPVTSRAPPGLSLIGLGISRT